MSCKHVGDPVELEHKEAPVKRYYGYGNWGRTSNGDWKDTNVVPLKDFNDKWAQGLEKGGKEWIGKEFQATRTFSFFKSGSYIHVVQGKFLNSSDTTLVQIVPSTHEEWLEWGNKIKIDDKVIYKIDRRPRVMLSTDKKNVVLARISSDFVSPVTKTTDKVYRGLDNSVCNKEEAESDLKLVGSCCGYCDTDLNVEDDYEFVYSAAAICRECLTNGFNESIWSVGA